MKEKKVCQECKWCVMWILNRCEGESQRCQYHETYEEWDNLDIVEWI